MEAMPMRPSRVADVTVADIATATGTEVDSGDSHIRVTGVSVNSQEVEPGDLFGALPGLHDHGATFATQAHERGASAILTDPQGCAHLRASGFPDDVPVIVADAPRKAIGEAAAYTYGHPSRTLKLVGVTGTNGKTTTAYFVDAALSQTHTHRGLLGTVELRVNDQSVESPRTTVEAPVLQSLLARMLEVGCSVATTEVSSHAAALDRISGAEFEVAVFTNLQWDHLDFHGTMDQYFADKARLFQPGRARHAVVCVDDEWGQRLAREVSIPVTTVATRDASMDADWRVENADVGLDGVGSSFDLVHSDGTRHKAESPLPGLVNVSNAAVAIIAAHHAGVPLEQSIAGVARAHDIPGRMERVVERSEHDPLAIVDYAHTPDALTLALEGVRPITKGRIIIIFGSDGDRDRGKRPVLGNIAARLADVIVLTDENPRSEKPADIRQQIKAGIQEIRPTLEDVHEIVPRASAVEHGLRLGKPGDTVIVTGKGHEPTQEIAGVFHRYNDRDEFLRAHQLIVAERQEGA